MRNAWLVAGFLVLCGAVLIARALEAGQRAWWEVALVGSLPMVIGLSVPALLWFATRPEAGVTALTADDFDRLDHGELERRLEGTTEVRLEE